MNRIISFIIIVFTLLSLSCKKEIVDDSKLRFGTGQPGNAEIDAWLQEHYLKPYNIEVLYRWDASELSTTNTLVPPEEKHVIPVMDIIQKSWIDVYNAMGDPEFIKKHSPKQYLLVGSAEYNSSGGLTTGFAEGGTKIAIFRINWFNIENRSLIKRMLKTVHHEYLHILNQKKNYQPEFELISAQEYTSTFAQLSAQQANDLGFVSSYAASAPGEDIAEMVSIMVTEGRQAYEQMLANISNPTAVSKLRAKEALIVDYYKTYWNIDFDKLIEKTQESINGITPLNLHDYIGEQYQYINLDIHDESLWGPMGIQAIRQVRERIKAKDGRQFDYIRLYFSSNKVDKTDVMIRFTAKNQLSSATATYYLKTSFNKETNRIRFSNPTESGSNATLVRNEMDPLLTYLTSQEFKLNFKEGQEPNTQGELIGGLLSATNPDEYAYGMLNDIKMHRVFGHAYPYINLSIYNEGLWSGKALAVVKDLKSKLYADAGQRKFSFIRLNFNPETPNSTALFTRFLLYNELNKYNFTTPNSYRALQTINLETEFDRTNNILTFKQVTTAPNSVYDIIKPGLNQLTDYLTSRKFRISFNEGSTVYTKENSMARLTNIEDANDYIDYPIEPIPMQYMLGEGFYKFQLKDGESEFFGAAKTALERSKADFETKITWEGKGRSLDHYVLNIIDNPQAKRAELFIRFTHIGSVSSATAQVNFTLDFDKTKNTIKLSNPVAVGSTATNIWPGLEPFLNYLSTTTFKTEFTGKITTYNTDKYKASLINVNNANDYFSATIY